MQRCTDRGRLAQVRSLVWENQDGVQAMKKVVGFTELITQLQIGNPYLLLCYEPGGNIVHLGQQDEVFPVCGKKFRARRNEVMYFNGGQRLENFCPECFEHYKGLLENLAGGT